MLANFDETDQPGSGEVNVITYKGDEEYSTDYFYEGQGFSEADVDPGSYRVEIDAGGKSGEMWVLAYPANTIDVANMDTQEIFDTVLASIQ